MDLHKVLFLCCEIDVRAKNICSSEIMYSNFSHSRIVLYHSIPYPWCSFVWCMFFVIFYFFAYTLVKMKCTVISWKTSLKSISKWIGRFRGIEFSVPQEYQKKQIFDLQMWQMCWVVCFYQIFWAFLSKYFARCPELWFLIRIFVIFSLVL